MHILELPVEIIDRILDFLPRQSKQKCLQVSRTLSNRTLLGINRCIELEDNADVMNLYREIFREPVVVQSSDIRCLSLATGRHSNRYIVKRDILIRILNACTHLQTIQLMYGSNQLLEYMYHSRNTLNINSVKTIYIPFNEPNTVIRDIDFLTTYHYAKKIPQLSLHVNRNTFSGLSSHKDLYMYLGHFAILKVLSLHFDNVEVVLHDILSACPSLQKLGLTNSRSSSTTSKLQLFKSSTKNATTIKSQLKDLCVDSIFINQDLLTYLSDNIENLHNLTLSGSQSFNHQHLLNALNSFNNKNTENFIRLPIKSIGFEHRFLLHEKLIRRIELWFPTLKRVDFTDCNFSRMMTNGLNIMMNFTGLNLEYLTINLRDIYESYTGSSIKTSLEIMDNNSNTSEESTCFQRTAKWKPENLFIAKSSKSYLSNKARAKRIDSNHICVITVKVKSIRDIHLYCHSPHGRQSFSQIINFGV